MRTLIVDDERLARSELQRLLTGHAGIEIVGEAASVKQAGQQIEELKPELLFLDIQMPGESGFDLLEKLGAQAPKVIFTTAFDSFALRAFEVNAVDYLLKPIEPLRLAAALGRITANEKRAPAAQDEMPFQEDDRVFVRQENQCWFVPIREISRLESLGNHTAVFFKEGRALIHRNLKSLEDRLPTRLFFRANRAQIFNLEQIATITPWFSDCLKITLKDKAEIELSRRQSQIFRERVTL